MALNRQRILSSPRYVHRPLAAPIGNLTHGVFDTLSQSFVVGEHHTERQAVRAAARYDDRYEEWMAA